MFKLYQSNNINVLKECFFYLFKKIKLKNILNSKIFILVPDNNTAFFLKMFISKKSGIYCNLNFILLGKFIWKIYKKIIPDISNKYYFNKNNLIWVINYLLPNMIKFNEFSILKRYLNFNYSDEKLFNLSIKIADIYDEYLMYRVDWLKKWENFELINEIDNIHQIWQSILWRKIKKFFIKKFSYKWSRCNIYYKFLNILNNKKFIFPKNFIDFIFIFNISYMPPIYLNTLYNLSKYIDINYFLLNPCIEYWYDQIFFDNRLINKDIFLSNFNLNKFNSLLLNYGVFFSEYLNLLIKLDIYYINCFIKNKNNNFLNIIKNNILFFKNNYNINKNFKKNDSLFINNSYGYLNEIIDLKDKLIHLILNKKYNISDIVVYVSDIEVYWPYIDSVFSNPKYKNILPYRILLHNDFYNKNILELFLNLLDIGNVNYTFTKLLYFLKEECIFKKFNINSDELNVIDTIIKDIGINIEKKKVSYSNKKFNFSTWIIGIKRILIGYCINDEYCIWNNIVPYVFLSNNFFYNLIEKISNFLFKIFFWKDILNKKHLLYDWVLICNNFLNDFFIQDCILNNYFLNYNIWNKLLSFKEIINFNKLIDINFFKIIYKNFLDYKKKIKNYSISHINFCPFSFLSSIPFKIVCLIGVNENIFPKFNLNCDLNLINCFYRLCDRNKNNNDKFIFLEKILSSIKVLYISYITFSFLNNNFYFPSYLLNILIKYISKFKININFLKIKNKFKFIKKKILNNNNNNIYINNFFLIKKNNFNFIKDKFYINLLDLCKFWINPIKYFLVNFLKINYFIHDVNYSHIENFVFNFKNIYLFRFKIINFFIKNKINLDNFYYYLNNLNLFPLDNYGKILWFKEKEKIFFLSNNIKKYYLNINKFFFNFNLYNINIKGYINICNNMCGVFKWLPKNLSLIDAFILWIDHLIYCYLGGKNYSYIYGYNCIWSFPPLSKKKCIYFLYKYIYSYINCYNLPIILLPKCANIWIFSVYNFINKKHVNNNKYLLAKKKLYNVFYGNIYYKGEIEDIYISYFFKKYLANKFSIKLIINEIEKWLLPMYNYLIVNFIKKY